MRIPVLLITASLHIIHFYEMSKLTVSYIHLLQFVVRFATAGVGQCCQTVVVAPFFVELLSVPGGFRVLPSWDATMMAPLPSPLSCGWPSATALFAPFPQLLALYFLASFSATTFRCVSFRLCYPRSYSGVLACADYLDMAIPLL